MPAVVERSLLEEDCRPDPDQKILGPGHHGADRSALERVQVQKEILSPGIEPGLGPLEQAPEHLGVLCLVLDELDHGRAKLSRNLPLLQHALEDRRQQITLEPDELLADAEREKL